MINFVLNNNKKCYQDTVVYDLPKNKNKVLQICHNNKTNNNKKNSLYSKCYFKLKKKTSIQFEVYK